MIIDDIKKAKIQAMKDKDENKKNAYDVVINKYMLQKIELKAQGKELVDSDMVSILQKTIKELTEEAENYEKAGKAETAKEVVMQRQAIEVFLPKMMDKEEIKNIILSLPEHSIPTVMKHFKANYAGKVDMRDVQEVLKSL